MSVDKTCSICNIWYKAQEYSYGNKEGRSYCRKCNREERQAYARGGKEAAKLFRETKRKEWGGT